MQRLDDVVRELVRASAEPRSDLSTVCGMSEAWLMSFARGKTKTSPNFLALQLLYEHLSGEPLV